MRVLLNRMLPIMDNNLIRADAQIARLYTMSQKRKTIIIPFCFSDVGFIVETRNLRVSLNKMLPIMDNNLTKADAQIARLYNESVQCQKTE